MARFALAATCKWRAVLQSQTNFVYPEPSFLSLSEAGRCSSPFQLGQSREILSGSSKLPPRFSVFSESDYMLFLFHFKDDLEEKLNRSRSFRRFQRKRAIHHKSMILRDYWQIHSEGFWTPVRVGELSKGKVHCSCWMCRRKSYDDPRMMDKRNCLSLQQKQTEFEPEASEVMELESFYSPEQTDEETAEGVSQL